MPPEVANHVAAVVLLGKPSPKFMELIETPPVEIGDLYAAKTIELCAPGDTICSGPFDGNPTIAHVLYGINGMVNEGAAFAASRL